MNFGLLRFSWDLLYQEIWVPLEKSESAPEDMFIELLRHSNKKLGFEPDIEAINDFTWAKKAFRKIPIPSNEKMCITLLEDFYDILSQFNSDIQKEYTRARGLDRVKSLGLQCNSDMELIGGLNLRSVKKSIFLNAIVCPVYGWLERAGQISEPLTLGDKFRMEQGLEVGRRARELYPKGVLINDPDVASASEMTKSLIGDSGISEIFEGAFLVNNSAAKADVLKRKNDDSWHMIEVKSSVNDKTKFIDDMAYTTMVILGSGLDISSVSLMLVSKDFRLGMKNKDLFVKIDHTDEVLERVRLFKPLWAPVEKITRQSEKPKIKLCFECRGCGLFKECIGRNIENPILDIPRLSRSKFAKLTEAGIIRIEDIPDGFPLTENQSKVRDCVQSKISFVGNGLRNELERISWPAFFLDFETVSTAIPLYPDIAPYTQIPTQYSIHKCSGPGHITSHLYYLADPSKDCRREIAKRLINHLKGEGSIIVYSSFEKTVLTKLASVFPDLSEELDSLINRLVDLYAIIRRNFYHRDFHGSISIKTVLPTLVHDISYDGFEIADGNSASAAFAYMALGKYEKGEIESVRNRLLEYCKQDTLAEVKLHQQLLEKCI